MQTCEDSRDSRAGRGRCGSGKPRGGGLRGCWREPGRRPPWLLAGGFTGRGFPSSPAGDSGGEGVGGRELGSAPPPPPGRLRRNPGGRKEAAGRRQLVAVGGRLPGQACTTRAGTRHSSASLPSQRPPRCPGSLTVSTVSAAGRVGPPREKGSRSWDLGFILTSACDQPGARPVGMEGYVCSWEGLGHETWARGNIQTMRGHEAPTLPARVGGSWSWRSVPSCI